MTNSIGDDAVVGLLADKVVMVTGGASGIGRAAAKIFARERAMVVVTDRDDDGGVTTADAIVKAGGNAIFRPLDITDPAQISAVVNDIIDTHGSLDGAFNNAGVAGKTTPFIDVDDASFSDVLDINLRATFWCMQAQIRQMLRQGHGAIVNTASVAGLRGIPQLQPYTASKHAVIGLTRSVALEYAPAGLRVNAICPGVVETPLMHDLTDANPTIQAAFLAMHPGKRFADPSEIGEMAAWLLSDAASFVTGQAIAVDGGVTAQALVMPS